MVKDDGDESILQEAQRLTHGPRNEAYGHPLDDYSRTAMLINVLFAHKLRVPLDAEDAAQIQMLVKLSRHQNVRKRDNMVDAAGYAWVTWACTEERERREYSEAYANGEPAPKLEDYGLHPRDSALSAALDSVSDDGIWRAAQLAHDPGELAPVGTGPLELMDVPVPLSIHKGVPTPKGRILTCGCFGHCSGLTPNCPERAPRQDVAVPHTSDCQCGLCVHAHTI